MAQTQDGSTPSTDRVPLWLDCDPGHDDAFAILLAAYHPSLALLGISTVHGNASLAQTTDNALSILEAIGKAGSVYVVPGAAKPICRPAVAAPGIHGASGLDGTDLLPRPPQRRALSHLSAVREMRDALLACAPDSAWLVTTGTLTNAALLFATYPEVAAHIRGLSIMGGAVGDGFSAAPLGRAPPSFTITSASTGSRGGGGGADGVVTTRIGNVTPWAEFNIACDTEAAQSILTNPALTPKTWLVPLDLTHQACASTSVQERLLRGNPGQARSRLRTMFHELLVFFAQTYADCFGLVDGPPLHDPLAVAVLLHDRPSPSPAAPDGRRIAFDCPAGERWKVRVCLEGEQIGRTLVTPCADESQAGGVRIPRSLDLPAFWASLEMCLAEADRATTMGGNGNAR